MLQLEDLNKDYQEMLSHAIARLEENTELSDFSAGSIARNLLEVQYDEFGEAYRYLELSTAMSYLSTAEGQYLDEIAKLFNMERRQDENDENFRYRIQHATQSLAKANKTAVRLACLSVDGVHDVSIKKYTRGFSTFDVYIIPEGDAVTESLQNSVQQVVEEVQAFGVNGQVLSPKFRELGFQISVGFRQESDTAEKKNALHKAEADIRQHILNLELEPEIHVSNIISLVFESNNEIIKDVSIDRMLIDGKETLVEDKKFAWDEMARPGRIKLT